MKINEISYEEVRNLGNYESVRIGLKASITEEDDTELSMIKLRRRTRKFLDAAEETKHEKERG